MNKEQMLLLKVAEECAELGQICSKAIRFGLYNSKNLQDDPNIFKIQEEFKDILAAIHYLEINNNVSIDPGNSEVDMDRIARIDKYLQVSRDLGILKD